jgi:hypothetical protein
MNGEDKVIFEMPDGWYNFEVVKIEQKISSKNNEMFVAKVVSTEDAGIGTDVYLVSEKGKRWFLKQLLKACDCPAGEDGVYDWSEEDVEGKTVQGRVEHQQEDDWIDRKGNTQKGKMRARIAEFKALEV